MFGFIIPIIIIVVVFLSLASRILSWLHLPVELFIPVVMLFIFVYAFLVMVLGPRRATEQLLDGTKRLFRRCIIMLILLIVNTGLLIFSVCVHASDPRRIPDDFAHWVERMTDALIHPYNR